MTIPRIRRIELRQQVVAQQYRSGARPCEAITSSCAKCIR